MTGLLLLALIIILFLDAAQINLKNFFEAWMELMQVMACACGHNHLSQFKQRDLTNWKQEMTNLSGISYDGFAGQPDH